MDPSYSALLKVRPLDPYSAQRLNDLRDSFLKTEQTISEVNSQLDAQLEKKYEEKRQAGRSAVLIPVDCILNVHVHVHLAIILSRDTHACTCTAKRMYYVLLRSVQAISTYRLYQLYIIMMYVCTCTCSSITFVETRVATVPPPLTWGRFTNIFGHTQFL